jgi:predicted dehydrogenase
MGSQHARVIAESDRADLAGIVDGDPAVAERIASTHDTAAATEWDASLGWDAAILAAPTEAHHDLALALLDGGLPVLVEKPVTPDLATSADLLDAAAKAAVPVMCGFVERFNPVVVALSGLLDGPVRHVHAVRHSPRNHRIATSVVYDLLIHDLDLALRLCGDPLGLGAAGWRSPETRTVEIVDATVRFADGVATMSADRWGQRKVRTVSVSTESSLIELDLLRQDVTVYRHVHHEVRGQASYRAETVIDIPFVRHRGEPLALQLEHFLDLVDGSADLVAERESILPPHRLAAEVDAQLAVPA